jgi:hypothetical protein
MCYRIERESRPRSRDLFGGFDAALKRNLVGALERRRLRVSVGNGYEFQWFP